MNRVIIAPSVLAADFGDITAAVRTIESSGASWIHLDVMDGHFVPPLTFGAKMVADIRKRTELVLDVHLMVSNPESVVGDFIAAGADYITFHLETVVHAHRLVQRIRAAGKHPGVAIVPSTPVSAAAELVGDIDLLLVMTVNPGFGGQTLIPRCLEKVSEARALRQSRSSSFKIEVDGGINEETAGAARQAGVDVLVSGSAFFAADEPSLYVHKLQGISGELA